MPTRHHGCEGAAQFGQDRQRRGQCRGKQPSQQAHPLDLFADQTLIVALRNLGTSPDGAQPLIAGAPEDRKKNRMAANDQVRGIGFRRVDPVHFPLHKCRFRLGPAEARENAQIQIERLPQQMRLDESRAAEPRAGKQKGRTRAAQVLKGCKSEISPDEEHARLGRGLADPVHLREIDLHPVQPTDLRQVKPGAHRRECQTVRPAAIDLVQRGNARCTRKVLHNYP